MEMNRDHLRVTQLWDWLTRFGIRGLPALESPHAEPTSNHAPLGRLAIGTSGTSTREVQSQKCREKGQ